MVDSNYIKWLDEIPGSLTIILRIKQKVLRTNGVDEIDDVTGVRDKLSELQSLGIIDVHGNRVVLTHFGKKIAEMIEDINSLLVGIIEFA